VPEAEYRQGLRLLFGCAPFLRLLSDSLAKRSVEPSALDLVVLSWPPWRVSLVCSSAESSKLSLGERKGM
jgi:hypothetical protein